MQALNLIVSGSVPNKVSLTSGNAIFLPAILKENQRNLCSERIALYFKRMDSETLDGLNAWFAEGTTTIRSFIRTGLTPEEGEEIDGVCFEVVPNGDISESNGCVCVPLRVTSRSVQVELYCRQGIYYVHAPKNSRKIPVSLMIGGLHSAMVQSV